MKTRQFYPFIVVLVLVVPILISSCAAPIQADSLVQENTGVREMDLVGHIGGPALSTHLYGDYALVGYSFEFAIVDISKPADPQRIAYLVIPANDIAVAGDHAFVAGRDSMQIVDLSHPARPALMGAAPLPMPATGITVRGNTAYIAVRDGLSIVDRSHLRHPTVVAWLPLPGRV